MSEVRLHLLTSVERQGLLENLCAHLQEAVLAQKYFLAEPYARELARILKDMTKD